ncbi:titin-like isoform X2 [Argiope bruennichi]|uniref:titin-like isoform X2 n=1 Tax=Argiope bruennichi TaxID=94029 RepID=UPI002494D094|nr:titin-like isoform X2 [Argiope bruennichi]
MTTSLSKLSLCDDNESSQSTDDTMDLEEGEILDSGAEEEEEEKDFSKSSLKEALDKSLVQNIEQLANHKGNVKSEESPIRKAAPSRKQKKMAANYLDPDRIDDESEEEDGWFPGSPKYKSKYNDKPVDYRMELEAYRGTPPSSPERKRRDEKSRKKKSSKKSKKTRKTIRRKDIKGVRVAKYKKDAARGRICKFFKEGKCAKGSDCMYSHHSAPPFKKKELCKFYLNGHCNKGKDCLYMHSEFPCKFYHTGSECYAKEDCRFSHAPLNEEMKRVLHDYLRISHGDDVRLRCDDDRDDERGGNDRERDRDRDRKRRRSCSPEPRVQPPKRTCLLGSPPRHIREAEETKRWQEEMKMLQQQQPGFEIHLSPDREEGSSAHFKPNFYQETLLNSPSPKKRPPNSEAPNSFHGSTSNNYNHESPSKVYIYDDDEFIEIDLPPPTTKQEPPEEFHWDNVRSMTHHEENHLKPFHENSQQDLDFTSDVKFDETTQFSEMESSTDCPPNLSPNQTSTIDFNNDEASNQGSIKIKEEKFSDEEANSSNQEAPAPPIVIPSHLPPKQRELLKRVLHNNQKKKTTSDAPGSPSATEGTETDIKKEESDVEEKVESQPKEYKWYSSEDEDDDDDTVQPLTAVLKRIQQDPPSKPVVQETKPSLKILDMFEHIQRKGKSQESSNGQVQQQKQSQNQFWENLFGGKPPSLPLPGKNSNNPPPSEPKRRTLLPDPILPSTKVEPVAPKEAPEIKDPRLKNRDPRKLVNVPVPAPKITPLDKKNDSVSASPILPQNAAAVKPSAVSSEPSKESIPYKLRGISAKPPNYSPLIHASQSNPSLLKDPRLRKHLNPNTNNEVIGNGKDSVVPKPIVQSKGIPPIPELLLKYEPSKAINIFESSSSKPAVKTEEPKPPIVYDPRRIRRDSRSNSGSDTPPHLTIVDTAPEEKSVPVLENEKEFVEEKKWLPPVLERNWAPPVLERSWTSVVEKTEVKEISEEPLKLETSEKSPPKKSPSPPPSTKEEFITVIKKEPSPVTTNSAHPIVPPLIIKKVKPTPPASHLPRAIADPRMARLHNRNSRPLVSSDTNSKSIVERKKLTVPTESTKMIVNTFAESSNSSEIPETVNPTESQKASPEETSEKASKEEKPKSAKSIPKKRRLSDKSDEKKKTVHRNRKSSMDYASPLNSCDALKDSKSSGYNSYNQRPKRTVPPHNERLSPNSGVSSSLLEMSDNSMPEFVLSDSSNLECDNSSDVNLRDRFKTIDPTASPFC